MNNKPLVQHITQIRVRYADTDQMKVVYYGKFFEYFEVGRASLIRSLGLPYAELESKGVLLPVIEAYAKYRRPAHYDDLLEIKASVKELPKSTLKIFYEIKREGEKDLLVEGYTVHGFINSITKKPMRPPAYFIELFKNTKEQD